MYRRHRRRAGLTFIELLLALAGTAFVVAAITAMLTAVSRGTDDRGESRRHVVQQKAVTTRIGAAIRGSRMVLERGDDYLVLWMHDNRSNTSPNLSEIRLIERDPATNELSSYKAAFPDSWTDQQKADADTAYQFDDDFRAITTNLKAGSLFPPELWAKDVTSVTWDFNAGDPQSATLVAYRVGLGSGAERDVAVNAAALRN